MKKIVRNIKPNRMISGEWYIIRFVDSIFWLFKFSHIKDNVIYSNEQGQYRIIDNEVEDHCPLTLFSTIDSDIIWCERVSDKFVTNYIK